MSICPGVNAPAGRAAGGAADEHAVIASSAAAAHAPADPCMWASLLSRACCRTINHLTFSIMTWRSNLHHHDAATMAAGQQSGFSPHAPYTGPSSFRCHVTAVHYRASEHLGDFRDQPGICGPPGRLLGGAQHLQDDATGFVGTLSRRLISVSQDGLMPSTIARGGALVPAQQTWESGSLTTSPALASRAQHAHRAKNGRRATGSPN
jgi:hypothetical protein